jgi:hypothetical protein
VYGSDVLTEKEFRIVVGAARYQTDNTGMSPCLPVKETRENTNGLGYEVKLED